MFVKPVYDNQNALPFSGDGNPRPAEECVPTRPEEKERGPSAPAVPVTSLEAHVEALCQGPPSQGVLLLPSPLRPLGRRRRRGHGRREPAAAARQEEESERDEQSVDEYEGRLQGLDERDYSVARPRGQLLHLRRRHGWLRRISNC